ncbi:MAG TPA: hypothetical protein DCO75_04120 [Fibrobacteres bacterium]|jgi:uncharacterized membrane protein YebE (DUF533 family)|nr:hypothetical protein [Fibrobacterota bacterium]
MPSVADIGYFFKHQINGIVMEREYVMNSILSKHLEDSFFENEDKKLIENLRAMQKMKKNRESLSAVSGIKNDAVLEKLVSLDVRPETLASLCMAPLVEVAWADGNIDESEKAAILSGAEKNGVKKDSIDYSLLKQWLAHKPSSELLDAWTVYIKGLCEQLDKEEKNNFKSSIMDNAKKVAEASGGLLGLGIGNKISKSEKEMLDRLEKAFE